MSLKLYNSLSSKKEVFKSISDKKVKTYGCGPTVYNDPHIGNFRTFVFYDLLNRVLQLNGYETETAVNITDIDDEIIDRVNQENTSLKELTTKYELSKKNRNDFTLWKAKKDSDGDIFWNSAWG